MRNTLSDRLVHVYAIIACIISIVLSILFIVSDSRTESFRVQKGRKHGILQFLGEDQA
jgi:cell shape-determining protein MreC